MKKLLIAALLSFAALAVAGEPQVDQVQNRSPLLNQWVQLGDENQEICREGFNGWYVENLFVSHEQFIFVETMFADPECGQAVTASYLTHSYDIDVELSFLFSEVRSIDLIVETYEVMPLSESAVRQFNRLKSFGYSDWKRNEKRDVTGLAPQPYKKVLFTKGDRFKGLFQVESNTYLKLQLGFRNGERPKQLNSAKTYHAVSPLMQGE